MHKQLLIIENIVVTKPNRKIPYKLPCDIEKKLKKSIQKNEPKYGSVDLIVDKKGD